MENIGMIKEIAGIKWKILDKTEKGYLAITEESIGDYVFDKECNNWETSSLRNFLNTEFKKKIEDAIGSGKLVGFERDLMALDGLKDYGKCRDFVSILTAREYQDYRHLLPNYVDWCWLATAWSTASNGLKYGTTVVSPSGYFSHCLCYFINGVRPVCIFSSSIFES